MLFKVDTLFGHVVEETDRGVVYQADGVLVDANNLRPCVGCQAKCSEGGHDPCIANLPKTRNACCGHGLDVTPVSHNPSGYVALEDGRTFRFSGLVGGARIREVVDMALKGQPLPEGFQWDSGNAWWTGLNQTQIDYVQTNIPKGLAKLVSEVTGEPVSEAIASGQVAWFEGLAEEQKALIWSQLDDMLKGLVLEALAQKA